MASWKLTLRHNLSGKSIPVKLKYTGNSSFPQISITVTSSNQVFSLTGWDADTLDATLIKFVSNQVVQGNVIYNLKSLQIEPYIDDGGGSGDDQSGEAPIISKYLSLSSPHKNGYTETNEGTEQFTATLNTVLNGETTTRNVSNSVSWSAVNGTISNSGLLNYSNSTSLAVVSKVTAEYTEDDGTLSSTGTVIVRGTQASNLREELKVYVPESDIPQDVGGHVILALLRTYDGNTLVGQSDVSHDVVIESSNSVFDGYEPATWGVRVKFNNEGASSVATLNFTVKYTSPSTGNVLSQNGSFQVGKGVSYDYFTASLVNSKVSSSGKTTGTYAFKARISNNKTSYVNNVTTSTGFQASCGDDNTNIITSQSSAGVSKFFVDYNNNTNFDIPIFIRATFGTFVSTVFYVIPGLDSEGNGTFYERASFEYEGDSNFMSFDQQSRTFTVRSNVPFELVVANTEDSQGADTSWVQLSTYFGTEDTSVTVSVSKNEGSESRGVYIYVKSQNTGKYLDVFYLNQSDAKVNTSDWPIRKASNTNSTPSDSEIYPEEQCPAVCLSWIGHEDDLIFMWGRMNYDSAYMTIDETNKEFSTQTFASINDKFWREGDSWIGENQGNRTAFYLHSRDENESGRFWVGFFEDSTGVFPDMNVHIKNSQGVAYDSYFTKYKAIWHVGTQGGGNREGCIYIMNEDRTITNNAIYRVEIS